jgi:alpha-glucosidase (family GH31 glycosyl hydrolase)
MRSGYSGSQRYGIVPWSGCVAQLEEACSRSPRFRSDAAQGIGYMHSDLGGFAGDYFDNEL